jgi:hypothetical protein
MALATKLSLLGTVTKKMPPSPQHGSDKSYGRVRDQEVDNDVPNLLLGSVARQWAPIKPGGRAVIHHLI